MDINRATARLAALAQNRRLEVFRILVQRGPEGVPSGEIAEALGAPHNSMSTHLAILETAGLVVSRRVGRQVFYALDVAGTRELIAFLTEDCCGGQPELCLPQRTRKPIRITEPAR